MTSSDLYEHRIGDIGKQHRFSLTLMKTVTLSLLLTTAFVAGLAVNAQTGAKKEAKNDDTKSHTTASLTSTLTISKRSSGVAFGAHLDPILKTVNATDDQKKSITSIVDEFKIRIVPLRKRHDELREEFLKALTSGDSGETIISTQSEFIRAQGDLNAQYLALRLKIAQVLTPEQNDKFKEYRSKQGWKAK